jgi:hypothetical protein
MLSILFLWGFGVHERLFGTGGAEAAESSYE